jgi:hypothetical protein
MCCYTRPNAAIGCDNVYRQAKIQLPNCEPFKGRFHHRILFFMEFSRYRRLDAIPASFSDQPVSVDQQSSKTTSIQRMGRVNT